MTDMTKQELLEYAEAHGITGVSSSMTKADIIAVIEAAETANPLEALTVDVNIPANEDLFGKVVADLQENVIVESDSISGTLFYVDDYTGFSSKTAEQSGNYLALHAEVPGVDDVTITVTVTKPSVLDADGLIVLYIADKDTQTVTVTASKDGYSDVTKTFTLTGLTVAGE